MKTPSDRLRKINERINELTLTALVVESRLTKAGEFREEDHPRADDGKFGSGSGSHKEKGSSSGSTIHEKNENPDSGENYGKHSGQVLPIKVREYTHNGKKQYSVEVSFHGVYETIAVKDTPEEAESAAKEAEEAVREGGRKRRQERREPPKVNRNLANFFFGGDKED